MFDAAGTLVDVQDRFDRPMGPDKHRENLLWAASVVARYGGAASQSAGEPVFSQLPQLTESLDWACREGRPEDVITALPVADVLGAAWERLGEYALGTSRLDAALAAANRAGRRDDPAVARLLRRRARLAMGAGWASESREDLERAYRIAVSTDDRLTIWIMLDRTDLAMRFGDWDTAESLVPELLARTGGTGDPLIQAMGLNRSAWSAFGSRDLTTSRERYEAAWSLAGLHEDPVVEARTCSGLGLAAMLTGDRTLARVNWRRALDLAEQLHDRSFVLHCIDGIACLEAMYGDAVTALQLSASVTAARHILSHPRESALIMLHQRVRDVCAGMAAPDELYSYAESVAAARQAVAEAA